VINSVGTREVIKDTQWIEGKVHDDLFRVNCSICAKAGKNHGACIQCNYRDCTASFHVRCAMMSGIIKAWDQMNEQRG